MNSAGELRSDTSGTGAHRLLPWPKSVLSWTIGPCRWEGARAIRRRVVSGNYRNRPSETQTTSATIKAAPAFAPQRAEVRRPVVAGDHRLAVDQKRRCLDAERSINDGREAVGPVMAVAREAADPQAIPAQHQPIAVMLDFVDPEPPSRWPRHLRRLARFDKAGRTPPLLDHGRRIGQPPGFVNQMRLPSDLSSMRFSRWRLIGRSNRTRT